MDAVLSARGAEIAGHAGADGQARTGGYVFFDLC